MLFNNITYSKKDSFTVVNDNHDVSEAMFKTL